jgi:uncharacterized membrane protein YfcA
MKKFYWPVFIKTLFIFVSVNALLPGNAYAYIDPGTGSYLLQLLIGALLGALFAIKVFWRKIKNVFQKFFANSSKSA